MPKKKFTDTQFGQFLANKLPDIAATIGTVLPDNGTLGIIKNIISDPAQTPGLADTDRLALLTAANQFAIDQENADNAAIESYNKVETAQVQSDDNYTRRARPTAQYFMLLLIALCYPVAWFAKGLVIPLPQPLILIIGSTLGVYTIARTFEKNTTTNAQSGTTPPVSKSILAKSINGLMGK
jgi:hypothetical protein